MNEKCFMKVLNENILKPVGNQECFFLEARDMKFNF